MVDGQRLGGEHRRMPVRHPRDQQAEPDARGHAGQRGQRGHALEGLAWPLAVHRLEVVEPPSAVEAEVLREADPSYQLIPWQPLLRDVQTEAHLANLVPLYRSVQ